MDNNSLAHTEWNCKYHIVLTPKYRRQIIYKQTLADINHLNHSAKLTVPTAYERVVLALCSIGLDLDPEKYTLRRLGAEFTSTT